MALTLIWEPLDHLEVRTLRDAVTRSLMEIDVLLLEPFAARVRDLR